MSEYLLQMQNITKVFPGVKALDNVDLNIKHQEIHALVGENGAGKSTLMKVLSGLYPHGTYEGNIIFDEKEVKLKDIKQSEKMGIAIIHQELALSPYLSISENIFIGNERAKYGIIDWETTHKQALVFMEKLGLKEDPTTHVCKLGVGQQQLVEIAKALTKDVKLLILDEPTAALNEKDSEVLLNILIELKLHGISSVLISHHLNEVTKVADSITILRDGQTVESINVKQETITESRIVKGMVGREIKDRFPKRISNIGSTLLEIKNWNVYHPERPDTKMIHNINISVSEGEIVGIAGLMGAGRTEFAKSVFGSYYGSSISGEIFIKGTKVSIKTIPDAINHGIVYLTEDRKEEGLVLIETVKDNIVLGSLEKIANLSVIDENKEILVANKYVEQLGVKTPSILETVENLSGGNQQKVVLSKWICANPNVLILDEPTRGIDVGSKYEIYSIINDLATEGKGCVFISSELEEILGISDRIYVMNQGHIVAEFDRKDATQELIMESIIRNQHKESL